MDFTREPIIETVITPKEGHKLVIRNSKAVGQEEFFVDAVEIVSFGQALFFRSVEKPKAFLVPTSDYEVLEVREARMVLKHVGLERAIKIGGGKESPPHRSTREVVEREIPPPPPPVAVPAEAAIAAPADAPVTEDKGDGRFERKRERRRHYRRRRGRDEPGAATREGTWNENAEEEETDTQENESSEKITLTPPREQESSNRDNVTISSSILSSLLPPPPNLISETIARYRENELFKDAFFLKETSAESRNPSVETAATPKSTDLPLESGEETSAYAGDSSLPAAEGEAAVQESVLDLIPMLLEMPEVELEALIEEMEATPETFSETTPADVPKIAHPPGEEHSEPSHHA